MIMSEDINKQLNDIISYIQNTKEYKTCIKLKEQMSNNDNINKLVSEIKKLQKEYIKRKDDSIKKQLDLLEDELNQIPIYNIYNKNLEIVNDMISYVKDELNNYFDLLLNKKKN